MKTIGIKLADGSFYPVLEEGSAQTKKLDLTTANNNQTKVMVDLYRSATCSMDDAEYVDSLQIENLVEHPNGEADISFTVALDENNQLDAQIYDPETGKSSVAEKIQLITRTIEERLVTDEFGITESEEPEMEETEVSNEDIEQAQEGEPAEEKSDTGKIAAATAGGIAAGAGLMAMASALNKKQQEEEAAETTETETETAESDEDYNPILDEGLASFNPEEEIFSTEELLSDKDEAIFGDIETDDTMAEDVTQEDIFADTNYSDDIFEEKTDDETIADDTLSLSSDMVGFDDSDTIFGDMTETTETSDDIFGLPEEPFEDTATENDETIVTDDDFGTDIFGSDVFEQKTEVTENNGFASDDIFNDEENSEDMFTDMNFDDDEAPAAGGISFTGLYDKETEMGNSSGESEEETKKKTKVPVIICLICAIICILAVILILFVIPSPCNVLRKDSKKDTVTVVEPAPVVKEEPVVKEDPVPAAKEDEIIVIEKAEEVVPVQPEPAVTKPENIVYKIKWGDTLWDIAGTYYKNPWKYKTIARYNGIKNPDHIISGTKIIIPAE